jgi:hypothetical protein
VLHFDRFTAHPVRVATFAPTRYRRTLIFDVLPRGVVCLAMLPNSLRISNEALVKQIIGIMLLMLGRSVAAADRPDDAVATAPLDVADIRHVMDAFHHAVTTHDGKGICDLFLDHGST